MFETKCCTQNDPADHRRILGFACESRFDIVFTNQNHVFHVKATFSIVCGIDAFLCIPTNIYIYIHIYICIYVYM